MKRLTVAGATALTIAVMAVAPQQAQAGSGDVAAGLLGGFALGAFVGSALGPPVVVAPAPVVVAPAPVVVAPAYGPPPCYWTRGRAVWDGYRWVRPRIQVCD